ncbi:hypothetical protein HA402_014921 [Bradysia odoriphaga]|nr:hypothetical protein HA402_014921 [Bradysia odoriphaga]
MSVLRNQFENFDRLFIVNSGLKYVERRKLRELPRLRILNFFGNDIESFDEDILYDLPLLEIFAFVMNKISVLPKNLLKGQLKLKEFWAWDNQIETIPQDFFINNKELTHIWFATNLLKKIDVNFNLLPQLSVLDLRQNDCISEQACPQCKFSFSDVQSLVDMKCNGKMTGICEKKINCNSLEDYDGLGLKCKAHIHLKSSQENGIITFDEKPNTNVVVLTLLEGTMDIVPDLTSAFEVFENLQYLDLGLSHIKSVERKKLLVASQISWLSFYGNEISQLADDTFDDLKELEKLLLADNRLTSVQLNFVTDMRKFKGQYNISDGYIERAVETIEIQKELLQMAKQILKPKISNLFILGCYHYLSGVAAEKPLFQEHSPWKTIIKEQDGRFARHRSIGLTHLLATMMTDEATPIHLNQQNPAVDFAICLSIFDNDTIGYFRDKYVEFSPMTYFNTRSSGRTDLDMARILADRANEMRKVLIYIWESVPPENAEHYEYLMKNVGTGSTCGQRLSRPVPLIANGFKSIEGDWPWHSSISHLNVDLEIEYKCGGTIITSTAILTAAHCLHEDGRRIIADRILVDLGKHVLTQFTHTQQLNVHRVYSHPNYLTSDLTNDIAIIMLSTEATFNSYVQPICLWGKSDISEVTGKLGTVVGWGKTEENQLSNALRHANIPVVSSSTCSSLSAKFAQYLTERTFCAGYLNGTGICNGDSGGGLVFEVDGVYRIRGIVSLTVAASIEQTCKSPSYVVFTDVVQYLDWIQEVVPQVNTFSMESGNENWTDSKINCKFGWNDSEKRYECVDRTFHSTTNNIKISTVEGTFYDGKTNSDVDTVVLSGTRTTYVPDMSVLRNQFENFDRLFIVNSGLKYVERRKLRELPRLRILNFFGNDIESFEEDILYDLPLLEIFAFVMNKISVLPKNLLKGQLKLKEFWAWDNQIETIPQDFFINNKELTHIWFATNLLKKIDVNFNLLPQLSVLDLRQNDCISEQACPQCKFSFSDVQSLVDMNCNGKTTGICEKKINCNSLEDYDGLGLKCKAHIHLKSSQENCIITFDEKPNTNVVVLTLLEGTMNILPDLTNAFEVFENLQYLDLGFSHIKSVERKKLLVARQISWLSFYGNEISQLAPDTFDDLKELEKLLLADNRLTSVHPDTFKELRKLTQIWLQKNQLETLPDGIFRNNIKLKEVYAGENKLKTIAIDFINLPNLIEMDLSDNECISEFCLTENFCHTDSREKMQEKIWQKCPKT